MEYSIAIKIWLLLILITLSAFFSSSETALFSLGKLSLDKIRRTKQETYKFINKLLSQPRRTLITILLGNEIVNVSFSVIFASIFFKFFEDDFHPAVTPFLPALISGPMLVLFGEIFPKTLAIRIPDRMAVLNAPLLDRFSKAVSPLRITVKWIADLIARPFLGKFGKQDTIIDEDFFKVFVEMGREEGILDEEEKELIDRVFVLDDLLVAEIMTPVDRMSCIPLDVTYQKLTDFIKRERYSRIPVHKSEDKNRIIGVLNVKDLLGYIHVDDLSFQAFLAANLKSPIFIFSKTSVIQVLNDFQLRKTHIGFVIDEGGVLKGLVTLEDVLEELFGEIKDEYDVEESLYEKLVDGAFKCDLRLSMARFSDLLNYNPPKGEYTTILQLATEILGRRPKNQDSFITEGINIKIAEEKGKLFAFVSLSEIKEKVQS